jgi:hypothetical protein
VKKEKRAINKILNAREVIWKEENESSREFG